MGSLQEQLLKAGLVDTDKLKQSKPAGQQTEKPAAHKSQQRRSVGKPGRKTGQGAKTGARTGPGSSAKPADNRVG